MMYLEVGQCAQVILQLIENKLITDKLGVEFSPKLEANHPFSTNFNFVGT